MRLSLRGAFVSIRRPNREPSQDSYFLLGCTTSGSVERDGKDALTEVDIEAEMNHSA